MKVSYITLQMLHKLYSGNIYIQHIKAAVSDF